MLRRILLVCLVAILAPLMPSAPVFADEATLKAVQEHLYAGRTAEAAAAAEARLAAAPDDDQARFALGAVQFLQAVEHLGQSFHRHGLASGDSVDLRRHDRPALPARPRAAQSRVPSRSTTRPSATCCQAFVDDLAKSEATLAGIDAESDIELPLNLGLIRLDMDGDGEASDGEALWRVVQVVANAWWLDEATAAPAAHRLRRERRAVAAGLLPSADGARRVPAGA